MARSVAEVTSRADDALKRLTRTPEGRAAYSRRIQRRTRSVAGRVGRALGGVGIALLAALLFGMFVAPIGINGLLLLAIGGAILGAVLLRYPRETVATPQTLKEADFTALPRRVEDWLDKQRSHLPAKAGRQIDELLLRLEVLGPQLAGVGAGAPVAGDARRLIGDHLPRLVDTFLKVAPAYRGSGSEPDRQLHDGLATISEELQRLSDNLVKGNLDAMAIEGKFLEQRYKDPEALANR